MTAFALPLESSPDSLTLCACGRYARNAAGQWCHRIRIKDGIALVKQQPAMRG